MAFEQIRASELLKQFQISESDLQLIREFGQLPQIDVDNLIEDFYEWLQYQGWYRDFFSSGVPPRVKSLQGDYWRDFLKAEVDETYTERRITIGKVHASINLPVSAYLAGMNFCQVWLGNHARRQIKQSDKRLELITAIGKLVQLDANIVMHVYAWQSMETIRLQGELTNKIVTETARVVNTAATGDFNVRYISQQQEDGLEQPINQLIESLGLVASQAREIAEGNYDIQVRPRNDKDQLGLSMNRMVSSLQDIGRVAEAVAQGNYEVGLEPKGEKDRLSRALNQMVDNLRRFSVDSEREKWLKTGMADLAMVVRGSLDITELTDRILRFLADYLQAQVGVFYVTQSDGALELASSYAFTRRKHLSNRIQPGEGLVGQVLKERKPILLSNVPRDYIAISSGLGEQVPGNIIVQPVVYDGRVTGVIELGSFGTFSDIQLELLEQVGETIAISIRSAQDRDTMQQLLEESQQTAEELEAQQEELQAANEELEEQAQALKRSEEELTSRKELLEKSNRELQRKTADLERQKAEVEQARAELQRKAEQLAITSRYKSEFLANMSHELRTPLNSLLLLSQSLADNKEGNLSETQVEDLRVIHEGGRSLLLLINDILDLSKVEAGKMQISSAKANLTALSDRLSSQFKPIAQQGGVEFRVEMAADPELEIHTDEQRLEQILRNLLSNAFKFTHSGSVRLLIEAVDAGLAFRVIDSGIGIAAEKQSAIFEAFQQADGSTNRAYGGTGLGLTISRELAGLLGGEIHLHSEPGQGSTFSLVLPRRPALEPALTIGRSGNDSDSTPLPAAAHHAALTAESGGTVSVTPPPGNYVLIVEDDPQFSRILAEMAEQRGFTSLVTDKGKAALKLVLSHEPKAVILDMGLPDTDGLQVLEALKASPHTRDIPVHIISARDEDLQTLQKGALGFLTKPASVEELDQVFTRFEALLQRDIKQLLLIEDDSGACRAIRRLLEDRSLEIHTAQDAEQAIETLKRQHIDCCVLDLSLPDISGFAFLERVDRDPELRMPPVVVYTGKELSEEEYKRLMGYTNRIVIKDGRSPERLQEEVELFLHSVHRGLPPSLQQGHEVIKALDLNGRKVLVVDDDLRNTYALAKVLKEHGLKVSLADNGQLALDKLKTEEDVELILMDIMMPIMDGYEAMKRIRDQISQSVPIIALTAKAMADDRDKCIEAGANDYMPKPVDINSLLSMMKVWLYH
ncbi:histidine kinase [Marinobacterium zhoushanense]|uniref:histidine kinase n=1 Tax=Marinobacterium zhoushanense TaxID=1679163 RepID=A0ABQ1KS27_9GAMM|nr:response regulator [Marinobacterium zhoushanense]GGC04896.1 histidine kinase [Marinobacterium zhoushanense]